MVINADQRTATADGNPTHKWVTIPYILTVLQATGRMLGKSGIPVAHVQRKTLHDQLMQQHDPLNDEGKLNVVYHLHCGECSSYYVGQTSARLMIRIYKHNL